MRKYKEKEGNFEEEIPFLHQLIITLGEAELKLEEAYQKGNAAQFRNMKEFILKISNKISEEMNYG